MATTRDKILALLKEGKYASQIAKILGISKSAVSQHIKKLNLTPAKLHTVYKAYELNDKLNSAPIPSPTSTKLNLRLHRLQRNYKLLAKPDTSSLTGLAKISINHSDQYIGKGFRITNNLLELEGIQLTSTRNTPAAILEGVAITLADNLARTLAAQYGLVIDMQGASPPKLMEIELTAHDMAERVEEKGIILLYHKDGYKVWMDHSFGLGSLESNKVAYIQKLTDFTNDIVEDRWGIRQQLELNQQIIGELDFFAKNIHTHIDYMYRFLKASGEGKPLPKKPKPEDWRQRHL